MKEEKEIVLKWSMV